MTPFNYSIVAPPRTKTTHELILDKRIAELEQQNQQLSNALHEATLKLAKETEKRLEAESQCDQLLQEKERKRAANTESVRKSRRNKKLATQARIDDLEQDKELLKQSRDVLLGMNMTPRTPINSRTTPSNSDTGLAATALREIGSLYADTNSRIAGLQGLSKDLLESANQGTSKMREVLTEQLESRALFQEEESPLSDDDTSSFSPVGASASADGASAPSFTFGASAAPATGPSPVGVQTPSARSSRKRRASDILSPTASPMSEEDSPLYGPTKRSKMT